MTVIAKKQRHIAPQPGINRCLSESRIRKYLLHEHRAAKDLTDGTKLQGDGRQHQIAQGMSFYDIAAALPRARANST